MNIIDIVSTMVFATLVSSNANAAEAAGKVIFASDEYCPYNCEAGKSPEGSMVDMVKEILKASGKSVEYKQMPWKRSLSDAKAGTVTGVFAATADDADGLTLVSEEFGASQTCFYAKSASTFNYAGVTSLSNVRIGIADGYGYGPELDGYIEANKKDKAKFLVTNSDEAMAQNLKMVLAGRVDLVAEDANVMDYKIKDEKLALRKAGCTKDRVPLYIALSPKADKKLADDLAAGIRALRADGRLKKILATYEMKDWK